MYDNHRNDFAYIKYALYLFMHANYNIIRQTLYKIKHELIILNLITLTINKLLLFKYSNEYL